MEMTPSLVCSKQNRVKSDLLICQKSCFLQVLEAELGIMFTPHTSLGICVSRAVAGDEDCGALGALCQRGGPQCRDVPPPSCHGRCHQATPTHVCSSRPGSELSSFWGSISRGKAEQKFWEKWVRKNRRGASEAPA